MSKSELAAIVTAVVVTVVIAVGVGAAYLFLGDQPLAARLLVFGVAVYYAAVTARTAWKLRGVVDSDGF